MTVLRDYERDLAARFLDGLSGNVRLHGVPRLEGRVPTFLVTADGVDAETAASRLVERGIGVWAAGNWYCVSLADRLPPASIRIGLIHYNTVGEVDRLLDELAALS
jgi:selenocysteine lyase/cysteine desulfurase